MLLSGLKRLNDMVVPNIGLQSWYFDLLNAGQLVVLISAIYLAISRTRTLHREGDRVSLDEDIVVLSQNNDILAGSIFVESAISRIDVLATIKRHGGYTR